MIKIQVRGIEELNAYLKTVPRGTLRAALSAMSKYLIGNDQRGLKHYPSRKQHGEGNPYQWQSDRQRKAYFASNGFGAGIPYQRTNNLKEGWEAQETGRGYQNKLVNKQPYAQFVQGDDIQRGHIADGWRKFVDIIETNTTGALRAASQAVERWIKANK